MEIGSYFLVGGVVVFPVATLPVAEGESESKHHDAERRGQHYKDSAIQRALRFFGRGFGIGVTHGASLGQSGRSPQRDQ